MQSPPEDLIETLGRKYMWWSPTGDSPHPPARIIAQVMNLGTYEDIRRLESAVPPERLAEIMGNAQPGWFSARSWEFWRGRLSACGRPSRTSPREGRFVPRSFEPRLDTLPPAQQEIWPSLRPMPRLSYVLYGGTAVALHL